MKHLFISIMVSMCGSVCPLVASPFLVSDPYPVSGDPVQNPISFLVAGLPGLSPISVAPSVMADGSTVLQFDLAAYWPLPYGNYAISVAAFNANSQISPYSAPIFLASRIEVLLPPATKPHKKTQ